MDPSAILRNFLEATMALTTPLLVVSLVAGVGVGILQTAAQVNEASVSYMVKLIALIALIAVLGPALADRATSYTKASFEQIAHVVR